MHQVRRPEVGILLSDIGTVASLKHFAVLPVAEVKIDQSFVQGLGHEDGDGTGSARRSS